MSLREGGCMCGAVRFEATVDGRFSGCYCKMCQRWSAGMFMGVPTSTFEVTKGVDKMTIFRSSDWASRAFCSDCGSNIYYHADAAPSPSVALGALDENDDLTLKIQFFVDRQPAGFVLANETRALTEAECEAMFAGGDD